MSIILWHLFGLNDTSTLYKNDVSPKKPVTTGFFGVYKANFKHRFSMMHLTCFKQLYGFEPISLQNQLI